MEIRKIHIVLYSMIAAFLSIFGGDGFSWMTFCVVAVLLVSALYLTDKLEVMLNFKKYQELFLFLVFVLFFNFTLFFFTDQKDRFVLFFIQLIWFVLAIISYFIKQKLIQNKRTNFVQEMIEWFLVFAILVAGERIVNELELFHSINIDIFHLLISGLLWRMFLVFLKFRQEKY